MNRHRTLDNTISIVEWGGLLIVVAAMLRLAYRAAVRLDPNWDVYWYHIPFAAKRVGMGLTYDFPERIQGLYQGFPPLADVLQGLIWLVTGSVNTIGELNFIALLVFAYFCWRHLHARLWVVLLLSLTTPLILIHTTVGLIDLFVNAMLAIGVTTLLAMFLFNRWREPRLLCWGLAGLNAATWSKFQAVPTATCVFLILLGFYWRRAADPQLRKMAAWVAAAAIFASLPYVKNEIVYHNPFWPMQLPVFSSDVFPYTLSLKENLWKQADELRGRSKYDLFVRSLLEIGHPLGDAQTPRWSLAGGHGGISYRSGGFWAVGLVTVSLAACLLGFLKDKRSGWIAVASILAMLCLVSQLPESHELRYYLFLPLTVTALASMLLPGARARHPGVTLMILLVFLGEFAYVTRINRIYYRIERIGYLDQARSMRVTDLWEVMEEGRTYCVVGFEPVGVLFTGPTFHEYNIVDRPNRALCPPGAKVYERRRK